MSMVCVASALAVSAPTVAAEDASAAFGDRSLKQGSTGRHVRVLQRWLTVLGVPTRVDGAYGRATRRSVRRYERANDMRVDGRISRSQAKGMRQRVFALQPLAQPISSPASGKAVLAADGRTAVAPVGAPPQVVAAVAAANRIAGKPYKYGGGHGKWEDSGYDCSGTVSYALHGAALLDAPRASGGLASYGKAGKGRWITVYANGGHAFVVIAGLRLDTSGAGGKGPRWRKAARSGRGFTARHPRGL